MRVCYKCFSPSRTLKEKFRSDGAPGRCDACRKKREHVLEASDLCELFLGLSTVYEVAQHGEHYYSVKDEGEVIKGGFEQTVKEVEALMRDGVSSAGA